VSIAFLLAVLGGLYFIELGFFAYAARLARRPAGDVRTTTGSRRVSVVVAAKDEEKNLPACLESLVRIDYPRELLEIIVVNDQSSDRTASIVDGFAARYDNVKRIDAAESLVTRGKANALSQGIDAAAGEFIFLTDADCSVPPTWVAGTLKYFDERTGIVGGVTLISNTQSIVSGIQSLDWDFLLSIASGAATLRKPVACLGNNLAFRKRAYEDVGGYRKINFSVTEDYALFKAVARSGSWEYRYPMDKDTLVETLPVKTLKEVFAQRRRWATGGKDTGLFGIVTLAPGFLLHWMVLISIVFSPVLFLISFLLKVLLDGLFVLPTLKHYGKIAHLKFILSFEIYYLVYVAVLPFSVYLGKAITWKGRKY
jgi:cellulose synthase/poly-beta-1,6-N-acetylglucosamine synthase-like glycosyltransferase